VWRWSSRSLTVRLTGTLLVALVLLLAASAWVQVGLEERSAREGARLTGLALSETISGALHSAMLANDREALHDAVHKITERSPSVRVRIFNKEGTIVFSSEVEEQGKRLDPQSEACFGCHRQGQPIEKLPPGDRTRNFTLGGHPVLGVIRPIENEASCATASCHAHPQGKRLLGVLDVTLALTPLEALRHRTALLLVATSASVLLIVTGVVLLAFRRWIHRPMRALSRTMAALGSGDYGARYDGSRISEFTWLGDHVNRMAHELERANAELVTWAETLERRVDEKTAELQRAQQQIVRVERMASLGKLAAVVAHEINNPLASVVTYSRLLLRRLHKGETLDPAETTPVLDAIASESARCGEIVSNLLLFARRDGSRVEPTDLNKTAERVLFLVKHKMDLAQVAAVRAFTADLPHVLCDPAQIEQALLALTINAIEAMPGGGTLTLATAPVPGGGARVEVRDTGVGMDEEVRRHIFEPFFSTKADGDGPGLGLGCAVVYGIVQRHGGTIDVESAPGQGTCFIVTLPAGPVRPEAGVS
jgi:two-component system NtrC family sensor kinase